MEIQSDVLGMTITLVAGALEVGSTVVDQTNPQPEEYCRQHSDVVANEPILDERQWFERTSPGDNMDTYRQRDGNG